MPDVSATQKGVEDPHRAILADIAKNRTAALAQELKEGGSSAEDIASVTGTPPEVPADDPKRPQDISPEDWAAMSDEEKGNAITAAATASETDEQRAEREKKEAEAKAAAETAPATEKLKIDGQEQDVETTKIMEAGRRALQKEMASDRRLEEATKAREEAQRLLKVAEQAAAGAQAPVKKTDQELMLAKEGLRDIVKKIQYGSEEEAAQALEEYGTKMASLGQAGRLTEAELHNILDLREAQKYVKAEFADVMGDANLKELFVSKVNKKLAAGDTRPYQEICKETGDELRAWRAPAKPDPTPAGGSRAAAAARKTTTISIPAASARLPAATTETPQDKPLSQRVDDINKSRGRPT